MTRHAASRVDAAIANIVYRITRTLPLLPREGTAQLRELIHDLFLSIRRGGNGFISWVDMREGAYVASWLQPAPTIARIYPIAAQTDERGLVCITPTFDALDRALHSLHYRGVRHAIQDIQSEEMRTAPVRKGLNGCNMPLPRNSR